MNNTIFDKKEGIKEKRQKIKEAKAATPRKIELVCLKNRYGKSRYAAQFTYYPQYDYFDPKTDGFTKIIGGGDDLPWK